MLHWIFIRKRKSTIMIQPTDKVTKKYLYVKNGVIFKILQRDNGDKCAMELNETNAPYITVNEVKKYFDTMEVGDVYIDDVFKKTIHGESNEVEMTFSEYYYDSCEKELASLILTNVYLSVEQFKGRLKKSNFPLYMIEGMEYEDGKVYEVEGVPQIELTEEKYNQLKEDEIKKRVMDVAMRVADEYGYMVTTEEIEIKRVR